MIVLRLGTDMRLYQGARLDLLRKGLISGPSGSLTKGPRSKGAYELGQMLRRISLRRPQAGKYPVLGVPVKVRTAEMLSDDGPIATHRMQRAATGWLKPPQPRLVAIS